MREVWFRPAVVPDDITPLINWSLERVDEPASRGVTTSVGSGFETVWVGLTSVSGFSAVSFAAEFHESHAGIPKRNPNATNPVIIAAIPETKFMVCKVVRRAGGCASFSIATLRDSVNGVSLRPSKYLTTSPITNMQKRLANSPIPPDTIGAHLGGFPGHHHKIVSGPKTNTAGVTNSETQTLFAKGKIMIAIL